MVRWCGRDPACERVGQPPRVRRRPCPTRGNEASTCAHGDRGNSSARACARAEHPQRRCCGKKHCREAQDANESRNDERRTANDRAHRPRDAPRAEDRELRRRRARQQIARRDRVLELGRIQPFLAVDAHITQQRDVRGRPTETDAANTAPLQQHLTQPHPGRRGRRISRRHQRNLQPASRRRPIMSAHNSDSERPDHRTGETFAVRSGQMSLCATVGYTTRRTARADR